MNPLLIEAPAKLNLCIRILRKRDDGFHEIDTHMVKLNGLSDELRFEPAEALSLSCDDPSIPCDDTNLVLKAVRAYESAAGVPCKFAISLAKRIPHGAGLGGGSSDAASTLVALDSIFQNRLGLAQLTNLAADIGSDVPFFLAPRAARCTGRGEIIKPLPSPAPLQVLILKPWFSVPTPDAYSRWADAEEIPGILYTPQSLDDLQLVNDLERPVFAKHRFLAELKQWLLERRETKAALLCGSGSAVFAVLNDLADAHELAKAARHELDPSLWHWTGTTAES